MLPVMDWCVYAATITAITAVNDIPTSGNAALRIASVPNSAGQNTSQPPTRPQNGRPAEPYRNNRAHIFMGACGPWYPRRFSSPVVPRVGMDEGAEMSGYRFLSLLKRSLICLFLASLPPISYQVYMLVYEARIALNLSQEEAIILSCKANDIISRGNDYLEKQQAKFENDKTQESIGLLLRSGNDINQGIKAINETVRELRLAIRETSENINKNAIPSFTNAVELTARNLNETTIPEINKAIELFTQDSHSVLHESQLAIEAMRFRVEDKKFDEIIENIEQATAHANESLYHVEVTTKRLTKPVHWFWRGVKTTVVVVGRIFVP